MRVAVYGGSFNPPHVGHAMVTSWLNWTNLVDEVWLMPTYSHAFSKDLAEFSMRVEWCRLFAAAIGDWVQVTEIERTLPRPSYSIDSLRALQSLHPNYAFRFVVGADVLPETANWKDWASIEREFRPIIVGRTGYQNPSDSVVFPGVSSTDIRNRIREKKAFEHLVVHEVAESLKKAMQAFD